MEGAPAMDFSEATRILLDPSTVGADSELHKQAIESFVFHSTDRDIDPEILLWNARQQLARHIAINLGGNEAS